MKHYSIAYDDNRLAIGVNRVLVVVSDRRIAISRYDNRKTLSHILDSYGRKMG